LTIDILNLDEAYYSFPSVSSGPMDFGTDALVPDVKLYGMLEI
jgi:hypothetical protein